MVCLRSSRLTPSTGCGMSADPPPETRQIIKSPSPTPSILSRIILAALTPFSVGRGCVEVSNLILLRIGRFFWNSGTTTSPVLIRSPKMCSNSSAMRAEAFPQPTTMILSYFARSNLPSRVSNSSPSSVSALLTISPGSADAIAPLAARRASFLVPEDFAIVSSSARNSKPAKTHQVSAL